MINKFILKTKSSSGKEIYWTGFVWVLDKKDAKPYKTRKIAESIAARIKYRTHDGSEFKTSIEAEEIIMDHQWS
jgi:hypothetical protein